MKLFFALVVVAGVQADGAPDCGSPFVIPQESSQYLDAHAPPSDPGGLGRLIVYVGDIPHDWKVDGPNKDPFRVRVFSSEKWKPQTNLKERVFLQQAKRDGIEPWTATIRTRKDVVRFFGGFKEPYYLEVTGFQPSRAETSDSVQVRVCRP